MATGIIINQTVDPSAGAGVVAGIGSIYLRDNGGVGELWEKTGAADTAWTLVGGASDHGALSGLADNDHPQYATDTALSTHEADTTAVHGIANTANLLTTATKLDDLAAPDDNTDLNATTGAHGLLPKLGGGSTNFLRADGTWNAPAGGSGAPDTADYLVGTAQAGLSSEIVVPAVGLALLDDTTVAAQRATLDLARAVPLKPPFRTGLSLWYASWTGALGTLILVQNNQYATPFYIPEPVTCTGIGVIATGVASSSVNLSIYADTAGVPDALVVDAGNAATTSTAYASKVISQSLARGWYWLACAVQGAAGSIWCNTSSFVVSRDLPLAGPFTSSVNGGYARGTVSGAAPDPWGATKTETARVPVVYLQL